MSKNNTSIYRAIEARGEFMKKCLIFLRLLIFYTTNIHAATLRNSIGYEKCLCSQGADALMSATRKITLAQAKALVLAALYPEERRAPGLRFETGDDDPNKMSTYQYNDNPRFLRFHVVWAVTTDGSDLIGWYDVDIYTGDVFSGVATCGEYYSKRLAALQRKVRRSLHLSYAQYRKLKTNGMQCVPG
jgi:hypothetical protein